MFLALCGVALAPPGCVCACLVSCFTCAGWGVVLVRGSLDRETCRCLWLHFRGRLQVTAARIFAKRKEEKTEQLSAELTLARQGSVSGRSTSPTLVPDPSSPVPQALAQQRDALQKEVLALALSVDAEPGVLDRHQSPPPHAQPPPLTPPTHPMPSHHLPTHPIPAPTPCQHTCALSWVGVSVKARCRGSVGHHRPHHRWGTACICIVSGSVISACAVWCSLLFLVCDVSGE